MSYALSIDLEQPFEEVVTKVKEALAANGFGIVAEVPMSNILRDKIGVEIEDQVILGACNPRMAHKALSVEPSIGLLLPCNVVVRRSAGVTVVEAINTSTMVDITENEAMSSVADEVGGSLQAALDMLRGPASDS